jgi:hypothetical protein
MKIVNRFTGKTIYECECGTMKECLLNALESVASLSGANLYGADLSGADLSGANLSGADLSGADLYRANISGADLYGADLSGANLSGANLSGANLYRADLSGANLSGADLQGANLWGANLWDANLQDANLRGANLQGANLWDANLWDATNIPALAVDMTTICAEGEIIGYKKLVEGVAVIKIPAEAKRSNATGRKCRASKAVVVSLPEGVEVGHSQYDPSFEYRAGATVEPKEPFCEDRWNECASGIHFFITRGEAERY